MTGKRVDQSDRTRGTYTTRTLLTDTVQSVNGNGFESAPHHGVLFEHLIEMVNREGEESAVGVCAHTCSSSSLSEQTDL